MSARAWAAFATVSTLWGIPYLFIKIAVDDGVPPAFLAFVRVALGAAVLIALAWRAGALGALRGRGRWLALYALFEIVVPFPLIAAGERHVASSLAAIIIAAVPLFVALLALRFDHAERATGSRLVGLVLGLAGVVALVVLGIFCTAAAFVFFGALIAEVGPGRALVITFIAPVVAVALGVTVLGERPGAGAVAGLLLILAGSWLSTDGRLPPPLMAVVTRLRRRRGERPMERRSHSMNAPFAWTSCWTTAAGSRSSTASAPSRR